MLSPFEIALTEELAWASHETENTEEIEDQYVAGFREGYLFALEWARKTFAEKGGSDL